MVKGCREDAKKVTTEFVKGICGCFGEDHTRPGLIDTPRRIASAYELFLSGYDKEDEVKECLARQFDEEDYDQIVVIDNIDYHSLCEHHWIIFHGKAHVGYIPNKGMVVGASKIPRVVEIYSRRLQQQERLTHQIAEAIDKHVQPKGVIVYLEGIHFCMRARGVQKLNSIMKTAAVRGLFKKEAELEQKFYQMLEMKNL